LIDLAEIGGIHADQNRDAGPTILGGPIAVLGAEPLIARFVILDLAHQKVTIPAVDEVGGAMARPLAPRSSDQPRHKRDPEFRGWVGEHLPN
jgi:hypothetical protein